MGPREWVRGIRSKAKGYPCFNCDYVEIVGSEWGEESGTFLNSIDLFIRVGGGGQSKRETATFKEMIKEKEKVFIQEFELPSMQPAMQPAM